MFQLIAPLFTPTGTKVSTILQVDGASPATFGMSFEVMDLQGQQLPVLCTFWEEKLPHSSNEEVISPQAIGVSSASLSHSSQHHASAYYTLGRVMQAARRYNDAINFFEKALKYDRGQTETALALSESVSQLQVQQGAVSAYTVGKQLQDAGLLTAALESYKQPLPHELQVRAEHAWRTVLKLSSHDPGAMDEAAAYSALAVLYWQDTLLLDQPIDLFKGAVAHGASTASLELERIQRAEADALMRAGELLYELTQYTTAEKYLKEALTRVPTHIKALAMLALVEQSKPPEENKDALASYTLGNIYKERGILDKAQGQFENALTKQPDYEKANKALQSVLKEVKFAEEHFVSLIKGAAEWVAIELTRRAMNEKGKRRFGQHYDDQPKGEAAQYRAKIHNFIGDLLQSAAGTHDHTRTKYYELAIADFNKAIELWIDWSLPYKNLADTYLQKFQGSRERVGERDKEDLYEAISNYNQAAMRFSAKGFGKITDEKERQSDATMMRLLGVDQATALVFDAKDTVDTTFALAQVIIDRILGIAQAKGEPTLHKADGVWELLESIPSVDKKQWSANEEPDGELLYNLAAWYGCAYNLAQKAPGAGAGNAALRVAARRYLVVCLVRDPNRTHDAKHDTSFIGVFETDEFGLLQVAIAKKTCEVPDLQTKGLPLFVQTTRRPHVSVQKGEESSTFDQDIKEILTSINLEKRGR